MAINEIIQTGRHYRVWDNTLKKWLRKSFWTKASDVEFEDGLTAEQKITAIENNIDSMSGTEYVLPNATSTKLGGVKIGNNISVSSGTISLTKNNVTNALGYTPAKTDVVTTTTDGLMTSSDKIKLNELSKGIAVINYNKLDIPATVYGVWTTIPNSAQGVSEFVDVPTLNDLVVLDNANNYFTLQKEGYYYLQYCYITAEKNTSDVPPMHSVRFVYMGTNEVIYEKIIPYNIKDQGWTFKDEISYIARFGANTNIRLEFQSQSEKELAGNIKIVYLGK